MHNLQAKKNIQEDLEKHTDWIFLLPPSQCIQCVRFTSRWMAAPRLFISSPQLTGKIRRRKSEATHKNEMIEKWKSFLCFSFSFLLPSVIDFFPYSPSIVVVVMFLQRRI
jgi:hypothetical protein